MGCNQVTIYIYKISCGYSIKVDRQEADEYPQYVFLCSNWEYSKAPIYRGPRGPESAIAI